MGLLLGNMSCLLSLSQFLLLLMHPLLLLLFIYQVLKWIVAERSLSCTSWNEFRLVINLGWKTIILLDLRLLRTAICAYTTSSEYRIQII